MSAPINVSPAHDDAVELVLQSDLGISATLEVYDGKETASDLKVLNNEGSLKIQQHILTGSKSSEADAYDMCRLGKNQQLVRHFRFFTLASFTAICTASWELGLIFLTPGLMNGGRAGLLWNTLWNFIGFAPIYLSIAEMASIAPTAGCHYHWVSEFAPESCQQFLSYLTGWSSTIAYQGANAAGFFFVGSIVQGIITVSDDNYTAPAWQCTLLVLGTIVLAFCSNVYGARILPYWQNVVFAVHILAYFAYIIPIWVGAPLLSHREVWTDFQNLGGWSNLFISIFVGQLSGIVNQVGIDSAVHMSEEVRNASSSVPRAVVAIYLINFALLFPGLVTMCYHLPSINDVLDGPITYPIIYVLHQSMSSGWVIILLTIVCMIIICANIVYLAAVTRDLFAFARDEGLPFSDWLSRVHPKRKIPENACIFSCRVAALLSLIYVCSPIVFYAITSLSSVAILQCYALSIGCLLWRRIAYPETIPRARFSLGRYGVPLNFLAVAYSVWSFFWSFWPQQYSITAAGWNWATPLFATTLIVSVAWFFFRGKFRYVGPVVAVRGRNVRPKHQRK